MKKRLVALVILSMLFLLPLVRADFNMLVPIIESFQEGSWEAPTSDRTITVDAPKPIGSIDFATSDGSSVTVKLYYNGTLKYTLSGSTKSEPVPNILTDKMDWDHSNSGISVCTSATTNHSPIKRLDLTDLGPISNFLLPTATDSDLDNHVLGLGFAGCNSDSSPYVYPVKAYLWFGTEDDRSDSLNVESGTWDTHIWACVDGDEDGNCDIDNTDCSAGGGEFYADRCCGGTGGDYTCTWDAEVNAYCGTAADGPHWAIPEDVGTISKFTTCPGTTLLSSGDKLYACGGTTPSWASTFSGIVPITLGSSTHDYICDATTGIITECAGNQEPFSDNWDVLGDLVNISGTTNYCTSDGDYTTNLDGKNKLSCETYGFTWTGTKCCSEADDINETYEDPGTIGACWEKTYVANGAFVANQTIAAVTGLLQGCKTSPVPPSPFPRYNPVCTVLTGASPYGQLFCSNTFQWKIDPTNSNRSVNKSIAWTANATTIASDCCGATACWTGDKCQANQIGSALPINYYGNRCEDGLWVPRELKYNWDHTSSGYCPSNNQCLVDPNGLFANNNDTSAYYDPAKIRPQCLAPGQYLADHYCENGTWTTRTKLIGLELLDYAEALSPTNYKLFCGTSTEALNSPESVSGLVGAGSCSITGTSLPCINNFCVLSTPSGIAWGVSLNKPIDDTKSILPAIGKDTDLCDSASGTGYNSCGETIWYNTELNSVISIPSGSLGSESFLDLFIAFIKSPMDTLKTFVFTYLHKPLNDYTFFNNTHTFNKMYAARNEDKHAFAFLEEKIQDNSINRNYLGVDYGGISIGTSPCTDLILRYDNLASCNSTSTTLEIVQTQRHGSAGEPLLKAWRDITAKLRLN